MAKRKAEIKNQEELLIRLLKADSEEEVDGVLDSAGVTNQETAWVPFGGNETNWAVIGNQQGSPVAALTEKLVNCIDHILICEALLRGIDPEGPQAPRSMLEAAEVFFGLRDGQLQNITGKERAKLAERIQLVATGSKKRPCYTVIDLGEGQTPSSFRDTFCALNRQNKLRIPFVQGKFHMGGTGVLPFCGTRNYQLIASRRHPQLAKIAAGDPTANDWGFTIVRRHDPDASRMISMYEYVAPNGDVPTCRLDTLPALSGDYPTAYSKPLQWGTVIKLYDYTFDRRALTTVAILDLYYELNRRLQQMPYPIRVCERRPGYMAHSYDATLAGMSVRLADDRAEVLEDGFPGSGSLNIEKLGKIPVRLYAFKKAVRGDERWTVSSEAIFLVLNGQTHGTLPQYFFRRTRVGLDYIAKDLMVVLDCSRISGRVREDLFMTSRDRLRDIPQKAALESALEEFLSKHDGLRELNHRRREEEIRGKIQDDKPLEEILRRLIRESPTLASLFMPGVRIPNPLARGGVTNTYVGKRFPTFFELEKAPSEGLIKRCPVNRKVHVSYKTDAANDYFDRDTDPGTLTITPDNVLKNATLWNGKATLVVVPPAESQPGDTIRVQVAVTDISQVKPFRSRFELYLAPEETRPISPPGPPAPPKTQFVALPNIIPVRKEDWPSYGFDELSGLELKQTGDEGKLDAYVNHDNKWVLLEKARSLPEGRDLTERQYVWGLVLVCMAIWHDHCQDRKHRTQGNGSDQYAKEDAEALEDIKRASRGISMVLLPTINSLARLTLSEETFETIS